MVYAIRIKERKSIEVEEKIDSKEKKRSDQEKWRKSLKKNSEEVRER